MTKKNILIIGDSFSSSQISDRYGWPILLTEDFTVTNLSEPGIGQYKILKKVKSINLDNYDLILISHTSSNRVHCQTNPLYPDQHLYKPSDVIFADAESKLQQVPAAEHLVYYYKYIFDNEYYQFVHTCCCQEIDRLTQTIPALHITHFNWDNLYQFPNMINYYDFWLKNRGDFAHYSKEANGVIYQQLRDKLQEIIQ
jgi:hypothetical protein